MLIVAKAGGCCTHSGLHAFVAANDGGNDLRGRRDPLNGDGGRGVLIVAVGAGDLHDIELLALIAELEIGRILELA